MFWNQLTSGFPRYPRKCTGSNPVRPRLHKMCHPQSFGLTSSHPSALRTAPSSSGLGRFSFKEMARVRIPLGSRDMVANPTLCRDLGKSYKNCPL